MSEIIELYVDVVYMFYPLVKSIITDFLFIMYLCLYFLVYVVCAFLVEIYFCLMIRMFLDEIDERMQDQVLCVSGA